MRCVGKHQRRCWRSSRRRRALGYRCWSGPREKRASRRVSREGNHESAITREGKHERAITRELHHERAITRACVVCNHATGSRERGVLRD